MQLCYADVKRKVCKVSEEVSSQYLQTYHSNMKPCQVSVQVGCVPSCIGFHL